MLAMWKETYAAAFVGVFAMALSAAGCKEQSTSSAGADRGDGPPRGSDLGDGTESALDTEDGGEGGHCLDPEDTETETSGAPDTDADADTDTDADTDADADSDSQEPCPDDMAFIPANEELGVSKGFCIDRYEASKRDASESSQGSDETIAMSAPGVIPWYVNPMSAEAFSRFQTACSAAQKRICGLEEWFVSCTGPSQTRYVFGDDFDREICNCVDTFCDDYCLEQGIPEDTCNLYSNCGYYCGTPESTVECFRVAPTAEFKGCTNEHGTFDMNGNLWEVVPSTADTRGYEVRGGAFNCASASARLQCTYNATWVALYAGFRCCKDAAI